MTDFPDFSEDYTYWTREGGDTLTWTSPRCARAVADMDPSRVELFRGHRLPSEQWTGRDWVPAVDDKPSPCEIEPGTYRPGDPVYTIGGTLLGHVHAVVDEETMGRINRAALAKSASESEFRRQFKEIEPGLALAMEDK